MEATFNLLRRWAGFGLQPRSCVLNQNTSAQLFFMPKSWYTSEHVQSVLLSPLNNARLLLLLLGLGQFCSSLRLERGGGVGVSRKGRNGDLTLLNGLCQWTLAPSTLALLDDCIFYFIFLLLNVIGVGGERNKNELLFSLCVHGLCAHVGL